MSKKIKKYNTFIIENQNNIIVNSLKNIVKVVIITKIAKSTINKNIVSFKIEKKSLFIFYYLS